MFSSLRSLTKPARSLTSSYSSSSLLRHPHVAGRPPSSVQRLGGGRSSFSHSWSYYTLGALANQSSAGAGMTKRTGVLLARFNLAALRGNGGWGRGNLLRRTGLASRSWSSFTPNAENIVLGLVGINAGVFMLWRVMKPSFMMDNFTLTMENFRSWRLHTLLTSAFSHIDLSHLVSNMIGLYFFGINIAQRFGPVFVVKLYITGGLVGSLFFLMHEAVVRSLSKGTFRPSVYALGASGATSAIILLDIFLFPNNTIYFYFIPVPATIAGTIMIGSDIWRTMQPNSQISGAAHLGGAVVAALFWATIKKGWF